MKCRRFFLLGFLLVGCSPIPGFPIPLSSPANTPVPSIGILPSPLPSTIHQIPSPTVMEKSTETSSATPTEKPTETPLELPTETQLPRTYVFPVQPSSQATFAEGVTSHGYPATDIFAPEGVNFVAVTSGVVDFVSYEDRWEAVMDNPALRCGLCIAIIGDDGVRYYGAHLSSIQAGIYPGVRVVAGQVLGRIGSSGDAQNTTPHLHFGISHPTSPEDWRVRRGEVDPFPFLIAWRDGHNVTPPLPDPSLDNVPGTEALFKYVFPVQPANNASFSEGGHGYPATDIFAPAGSQFVAVTDGIVDLVSGEDLWDPLTNDPRLSGGLWITILGDDGVRYYGSHLFAITDGIRSGVKVRAGDLLGLVGNSGSARTTPPHLHFEISRPLSAQDWMSRDGLLDPIPFLRAWKTGHNLTPALNIP
jgi:murein DD-endopeptidase MepM/ murein hydrolase activator NlpD